MLIRVLFIIAVIGEAIVLIAPYLIGKQVELQLETIFDGGPDYQVEIQRYDRGWWNSDVAWSIRFDRSNFPADHSSDLVAQFPKVINFQSTIEHGPFLSRNGLSLGWANIKGNLDSSDYPLAEKLRDSLGLSSFVTFSGYINLNGDMLLDGQMPAIKHVVKREQLGRIRFSGLDWSVRVNRNGRSLANLSIPQLELEVVDQFDLTLLGVEFSGEGQFSDLWGWTGDTEFSLDTVALRKNQSDVMMRNARMITRSRQDVDHTVTVAGSYTIDQLQLQDNQLTDFKIGLQFERIRMLAATDASDLLQVLGANTDDPLQIQMELNASMQKLLSDLLPSSPALSVTQLGFRWNGEAVKLEGEVRFDGREFESPTHFYDLGFWRDRLHVNANMEMDKLLAESIAQLLVQGHFNKSRSETRDEMRIREIASAQADVTLAQLTRQRQLLPTQSGYEASFVLEEGQARLNGRLLDW